MMDIQVQEGKSMSGFQKHKWEIAAGAALVLAVGVAGAVWVYWPESPHLDKAKELVRKLKVSGTSISREERQVMQDELRTEARQLSPEEKKKLQEFQDQLVSEHASKMGDRMEKIRSRISKFFELAESKRNNFLDSEIDKIESARKAGDESKADSMLLKLSQFKQQAGPEDKDLIEKFEKAVNERMKERGVKPLS
jgi:hypothetical protein